MAGPGGPADPKGAPLSRTCPGCGWANPPAAAACEFCRMPFERAAPRPRQPVSVACPHCRREALRNPGDHLCPDCGQDDRTPTNVVRKGVGAVAPAVRGFRPSREVLIGLVIVAPTLLGVTVFLRSHGKAVTADHIRQIRKMVEIYGVENGGYPAELSQVERRFGPIPAPYRVDGWDRPLRYTVRKPYPGTSESGETLYDACELRSAGRNGTFGDEDDLVWNGPSQR